MNDKLESRRLKKIFDRVVESQMSDDVLAGNFQLRSLTATNLEYVIISIRFATPDQVSTLLGRVIEIASRHQAAIDGISGCILVAAFGVQPHAPYKPGAAVGLVAELLAEMKSDLKIVYGGGMGYYGCFGSRTSMRFSFVVQNFESALALLAQIEFGTARELRP